ncbi:hypothetical protein SARC_17713, partial [Sphaeroforma arctica JP610]
DEKATAHPTSTNHDHVMQHHDSMVPSRNNMEAYINPPPKSMISKNNGDACLTSLTAAFL